MSVKWKAEEIENRSISSLVAYPGNARTHGPDQIEALVRAILEFGFTNPLLIKPDGMLIAGHGRLEAARRAGMDTVPCIVIHHLSERQYKGLVLADNKIAQMSGWDFDKLSEELSDLAGSDFDLALTGFDEQELDALLKDDQSLLPDETLKPQRAIPTIKEGKTKQDAVPVVPKKPVSKLGDVWVMGSHRCVCGDSRSPDAWGLLMGGGLAKMVHTDPPYGIAYTHDNRPAERPHKFDTLKNDNVPLNQLLPDVFKLMIANLAAGGCVYVWHASRTQIEFEQELRRAGVYISEQLIWKKGHFAFGRHDYHFQHEPCFYGWKEGGAHEFFGERNQSTIWDILYDNGMRTAGNDTLHPTQKPVEIPLKAVLNSSREGDIVLDPFGGSGSTLIACEKSNRACRTIELDEVYCDVIVTRWQDFSGKEAVHEATGKTFAQIKAEAEA